MSVMATNLFKNSSSPFLLSSIKSSSNIPKEILNQKSPHIIDKTIPHCAYHKMYIVTNRITINVFVTLNYLQNEARHKCKQETSRYFGNDSLNEFSSVIQR